MKKLLILLTLLFLVSCDMNPAETATDITSSGTGDTGDGDTGSGNTGDGDTGSGNTVLPTSDKAEFISENWFLPYDKPSKYKSYGGDWSDQIKKEWAFYKRAMIDRFDVDLACRNNKDSQQGNVYNAFSEGIAYGLIFSLYMNDEEYFQKVYDAAEKLMRLETGYYGWRYNVDEMKFNGISDKTSATDAEMEIAYALYSAAKFVEKGYWSDHKSTTENNSKGQTYKERADEIMGLILDQGNEDGHSQVKFNIILPGDENLWFGARATSEASIIYNPSYFMPGYIRALSSLGNKDEWDNVLSRCYELQSNIQGNDKGLSADWCGADGGVVTAGAEYMYGAQKKQYSMYLDAIRVPFRIGMDAVWYGSSEARDYCNNAAGFINSWEKAGLYTLNGDLMRISDQESDYFVGYIDWMRATLYDYEGYVNGDIANEDMSSTGFYSLAMWSVAILGSDNEDLKVEFANKLKNTWSDDALIDVVSGKETMPRFGQTEEWAGAGNHYFIHSLVMFGALFCAGAFPNILADLE